MTINAVFHRQKNNNINNAKDNICNIKAVKVE